MQPQDLRAELSNLAEKYEALEKKFNAISATLLQKVVTEDKTTTETTTETNTETNTETDTKAAEQEQTRDTAVKIPPFLPYTQIRIVIGENLTSLRRAEVWRPRQHTSRQVFSAFTAALA